jgi:hypothetical protein
MSPSRALALIREFPFLPHNSNEVRQWTIREKPAVIPSCELHPPCTESKTFEVSMPEMHAPCIEEYLATLPDFDDFTLSDELGDLVEATINYP